MRNHATLGNAGVFALVFALVLGGTVLVAPPTYAAARPTIAVSQAEALVGDTVVLSGKARARKGKRVWIQMKSGGSWTRIAKTRVRTGKKYKKKIRFGTPGEKVLRVKVVGKRATKKQAVRIFEWRDVTWQQRIDCDRTRWAYECFVERDGRFTNGEYTARTMSASYISALAEPGANTSTDFSLRRECSEFSALIGLDDESPFGSVERIEVFGDGQLLFSRDMTNDESVRPELDVAGVQRLRLKHTMVADVEGADDAFANFGDMKVKCLS